MKLAVLLKGVRALEDLPALAAALGHEPLWDPVPGGREPVVVIGRRGDFPWYAVAGEHAADKARALARRLAARGRLCGAMGLDAGARRLTLTVSLDGAPRLTVDLDAPDASALAALGRLASGGGSGAPGYAAQAADDLRILIGKAYDAIEKEQVVEVSAKMNGIFRDVIGATEDSLFGEVGVRPARGRTTKAEYEVFVTEDGREKPLSLANGASRRAIGVSVVLSLAEETRTKVPFVADSLLHAISGSVRRRIVEYLTTGDRIGQPILFGTRADFLDPEVKQLLKSRAGRSYTLTSQTHVGRDVVRATPNSKSPKQAVVCNCALDEFCASCERTGDSDRAEEGRLVGPRASEVMV